MTSGLRLVRRPGPCDEYPTRTFCVSTPPMLSTEGCEFAPQMLGSALNWHRPSGHCDHAVLLSQTPGATQMAGLLSDAILSYSKLRTLLAAMTAAKKTMVVSNSWGMFSPSSDFPVGHPGNYSDNPNHPFNLMVATLEAEGADILFAAGNCGKPSAACPVAAGVVAAVRTKYRSGKLSPLQLRSMIQKTATDKSTVGFDYDYGWGILDVAALLKALAPA